MNLGNWYRDKIEKPLKTNLSQFSDDTGFTDFNRGVQNSFDFDASMKGLNKELAELSEINLGEINYDQINLNYDQDLEPFAKGAIAISATAAGSTAGIFIGGSPILGAAAGAAAGQAINKGLFGEEYKVEDAAKIQNAAVNFGKGVQKEAVAAGTIGQKKLVESAASIQAQAIDFGERNNLGSNPTAEEEAARITNATEVNVGGVSDSYNAAEQGFTQSVETNIEGITSTGENILDTITSIEDMFNVDEPANVDVDTSDFTESDEVTEDTSPFEITETSTSKDDAMTEEERLAMIRRLLLNRYGREDTILGGGKDTKDRRTYAL